MAQARNVRLVITGKQYPPADEARNMTPDERERLAVVTRQRVSAEYYRREDSYYFFYDEPQDEGNPPARTRVKCRQGFLELTRRGGMEGRMVFEPGVTRSTEYPTPYGRIYLDIMTEKVVLREEGESPDSCPQITVEYALGNEGRQIGKYQLQIEAETVI